MGKLVLLFLAAAFIITGCGKNCFKSAGEPGEITYGVEGFNKIWAQDKIDVYLTQDSLQPEQIIVRGGGNIISGLLYEIKDSVLTLKDGNGCNWGRDLSTASRLKVYVRLKTLKEIWTGGGAAFFSSDTLWLKDMKFTHEGAFDCTLTLSAQTIDVVLKESGGLTLNGRAGGFPCVVYDFGTVDARNFAADFVYPFYYSPRPSYFRAVKQIAAEIYGTGNVVYFGRPDSAKTSLPPKSGGRLVYGGE